MNRVITEKTREIRKVYEECQKIFEPSVALLDEMSNIDDAVEKEFYVMMRDFFMQQKQMETIEKGIF